MAPARHMTVRLPWRPAGVRVAGAGDDAGASEAEAARQLARQVEAQRERLASAAEALRRAAAKLEELAAEIRAAAEAHLADLALEIARKVLLQEIQAGRYAIDPIVAEAMRRLPAAGTALVRLNPADCAACAAAQQAADGQGRVEFVPDPSVPLAGCVVETPGGLLEYTVAGGLEAAGKALRETE